MPRLDGTGPCGLGPGTGRRRGGYDVFSARCGSRRPSGSIFLSLAATVVGLVVKDAMNPEGITRRVFQSIRNQITLRLKEPKTHEKRMIRSVEAEVLTKRGNETGISN